MQSVPGLIEKEVFGFTETDLTTDLDLYMSRVLEKYYSEILRITTTDENFLLVNYDQGILSIIKRCLSRLGITPEPGYLKKMEARMEFDGKSPSFFFKTEQPASNDAPYLQKCIELYDLIENIRMSSNAVKNKLQQEV